MKTQTSEQLTRLVLRTCNADMTSYGGFVWPESGHIEAPDFKRTYDCGHGLHGLLEGHGDGKYLNWSDDAKWLVVKIFANDDLLCGKGDLTDKCKFREGTVVYCGDRSGAVEYLKNHDVDISACVAGQATASGYAGQATASGYGGQATASGEAGQATASGEHALALTWGSSQRAKAGRYGIIALRWFDGNRFRLAIGYIGENGISQDIWYRVTDSGLLIQDSNQED